MTTADIAHTMRPQLDRRDRRLFATKADEPRARRSSDIVTLVGGLSSLGLVSVAAEPTPGFADALAQFIADFPTFLDPAWQFLSDMLALLALLLVAGTLLRRRWSISRDVLLSTIVATAVWLLAARIVMGSWPAIWDAIRAASPPPWYPSLRLALFGAVVMTASPHLTRPVRRLSGWILALTAFSLVALEATTPLGAIAGLLVAGVAAAAVHLAFGSSGGRPSLEMVETALAQLGVRTTWLGAADRQEAGVFVVHATDLTGRPLVVKVYGRDAHDATLISTIWRTVWYREAGSPLRFGRLQQVEHEAFLTLFARQAGVPTDEVVTAGATAADDALLVLRRRGEPLADGASEPVDPSVVSEIWSLLGRLHDAGIAHGQVDDRHLLSRDGELGLVGFRGATVAATDNQLRTDQVQALITTAQLVGEDRAASIAVDALGPRELSATLPYLQLPALTSRQRERVRGGKLDLEHLRKRAAEIAGTEPPALMQLRRITIGSIIRVVLPALAVVALISAMTGIDLNELADQLEGASWWLIAVAFAIAQLPRFTQAVSTLGAAPVPLPLGPVYALQLAVSYVNLAIPTTAARIAVNIRFFQRHGVPPAGAVTAGAIDGFMGFVTQATLLLLLLLFTPSSLDLDLGSAVGDAEHILLLVIAIALLSIGILAAVARWRRFVLHWAKRLGSEAWGAVRGLRSPRRIALLVGGSLATELIFPIALATFTLALGYHVSLGQVLLINISVGLLAGLLPIPGGIGVVEGGLTFGLVQAGVPESVAFAAVLLYRAATFYLPPVWGFFALRWLERNDHL